MESRDGESGTTLAHERTNLAYDRNRWAAERTLMAWIRTSISMVTFGFAIDGFFAYLQRDDLVAADHLAYHWFGILLVVAGVLLLVLAIAEHAVILKKLKRREPFVGGPLSLPLMGASLVLLIGVAALLLIAFQPH